MGKDQARLTRLLFCFLGFSYGTAPPPHSTSPLYLSPLPVPPVHLCLVFLTCYGNSSVLHMHSWKWWITNPLCYPFIPFSAPVSTLCNGLVFIASLYNGEHSAWRGHRREAGGRLLIVVHCFLFARSCCKAHQCCMWRGASRATLHQLHTVPWWPPNLAQAQLTTSPWLFRHGHWHVFPASCQQ